MPPPPRREATDTHLHINSPVLLRETTWTPVRLFCVHVSFTPAWLHFLHLWIPKWQRAVDTQAEEMVPLSLQLLRIYDMLTMYLHISRQG